MSEFTGKGFSRTNKELAELHRVPGSKLADEMYRNARQTGMSKDDSVKAVFKFGARCGGDVNGGSISGQQDAVRVYAEEKSVGRHHGEALDEVLLLGYLAAKDTAELALKEF